MSEDTLPPVLACVENALLPETYKHAVDALARCESLDECKSWSDKAAALSSYAKQADDPELENMARRIRARAVRRCGELLREFDGRGGDRRKNVVHHDFAPQTRREAAAAANIRPSQQLVAMRIAKIAEQEFDAYVEDPNPPGTTVLALIGKTGRPSRSETRTTHTSEADLAEMWRKRFIGDLLDGLVSLGGTIMSMESHTKARHGDADGVVEMIFYAENVRHLPAVRKAIDFVELFKSALKKAERAKPRLHTEV